MRNLLAALLALILSSAVFGTVYLVAQQVERQGADDGPERLASQVASEVRAGSTLTVDALPPVDLGESRAPFVVVVDRAGKVVAGNASLNGGPLEIPAGVLAAARATGRDAVTWQPSAGLRFATVEYKAGSRVVVAGQSLAPSESRTDQLGFLILLAWLATTSVAIAGLYASSAWARNYPRP